VRKSASRSAWLAFLDQLVCKQVRAKGSRSSTSRRVLPNPDRWIEKPRIRGCAGLPRVQTKNITAFPSRRFEQGMESIGVGLNSIDGFAITYWHQQMGRPREHHLARCTVHCYVCGSQTQGASNRGDILESPIESRRLLVHNNIGRPPSRMPNGYREDALANFLVK